ncbi:hypothetical protein V2J09_019236 [Rumex salicifolius]
MALYNPMEDKQLNFYQPLLSVRRSPSLKSSCTETEEKKKSSNPLHSIPPLPYYKSELTSGPLTSPGVIPFNWERIPGRPKYDNKPHNKVLNHPPPIPKLPPGRRVIKLEDDEKEENGSSHSEAESCTYLDALDMLSCSESSFMNCSLSGVGGLDSPSAESSGISLDRDIMMGRFLPAAKAVASETPQLGSRKQMTMNAELPREVKQVVLLGKQNSRYCYNPTSLPQHQEDVDESEEEDDDYVETENVSTKLCSLVPWFCMLNPIPGMRDEAALPLPSVHKPPKKYSEPGIYEYNKSEKAIRDAVYEKRRLAVYQKSDTHLRDELKKNSQQNASLKLAELPHPSADIEKTLCIDSAQIKKDEDSNPSSSETTTKPPPFQEVLTQEVQKENGMISSDLHAKKHSKRDDKETIRETNPILPPPLPKSPTESWLSRALPSMSTKQYHHSKTYLGTKNLALKPPPAKPKWEKCSTCTMVIDPSTSPIDIYS